MAGDRKEGERRTGELRHKSAGFGTHGEPVQKPVAQANRDQPEGNGATGKPAAFPDKP